MNSGSQVVRVGLVGYGFAGRTFHAPLVKAVSGLTLNCVVSRHPDAVRSDHRDVWVVPDIETMLASGEVDLVVIATPNETHAGLARQALKAGKHVVIDKPFALSLDEARDLASLARTLDRRLRVFHNRRWDSDYLTVKTAIEGGVIGTVSHYESKIDRFRPHVRDRWRERAEPGSGIWFDIGPHLIDQALQLFGLPDKVIASIASQRPGALADDWAHVILTYGQMRAVLGASMLAAGGSSRFIVHGTRGSLVKREADRQESQLLAGMIPGSDGWGEDPDCLVVHTADEERRVPATPGDQRSFYEGIAGVLLRDEPEQVRLIEAIGVMAVIEAGIHSAKQGYAVALPMTIEERLSWN